MHLKKNFSWVLLVPHWLNWLFRSLILFQSIISQPLFSFFYLQVVRDAYVMSDMNQTAGLLCCTLYSVVTFKCKMQKSKVLI